MEKTPARVLAQEIHKQIFEKSEKAKAKPDEERTYLDWVVIRTFEQLVRLLEMKESDDLDRKN